MKAFYASFINLLANGLHYESEGMTGSQRYTWPIYTRFKSTKKVKASYCGQVGSKVGWLGLIEIGKPIPLGKVICLQNFVLDKKRALFFLIS